MIIPPWVYVAGGAGLVALGAWGGWTVSDWRHDSKALTALADATKAANDGAAYMRAQGDAYEKDRMTRRSPRCGRAPSTRYIAIALCLLTAPSLLMLAACSTRRSPAPTPVAQANLEADCPPVEARPFPFLDPERLLWEMRLVTQYGDCANRHHRSVEASVGRVGGR